MEAKIAPQERKDVAAIISHCQSFRECAIGIESHCPVSCASCFDSNRTSFVFDEATKDKLFIVQISVLDSNHISFKFEWVSIYKLSTFQAQVAIQANPISRNFWKETWVQLQMCWTFVKSDTLAVYLIYRAMFALVI